MTHKSSNSKIADPAAGGRKVSAMSVLRNTKHVLGFLLQKVKHDKMIQNNLLNESKS